MKTEFKISVKEIIKETIVAFVTYTVLSCIACAVAWPLLNLYNKRRKEKEPVPSPESFENVEMADDVHFTEEGHPDNQEEAE